MGGGEIARHDSCVVQVVSPVEDRQGERIAIKRSVRNQEIFDKREVATDTAYAGQRSLAGRVPQ